MPDSPIVTLLMAAYNAEKYITKALDSALKQQTLREVEVIAVDDCSTDSTGRLLDEYAEQDSRLRVVHLSENVGQAKARNMALREARGAYIGMLDADDWLSEDALQLAVNEFTNHPETDSLVFQLMQHFEDGREVLYPNPEGSVFTGEEAFRLSLDWRLHGLYLVRREIHLLYPYDDSCRLYSDDNTTRLHYLHSRQVRFCQGIYYYRKYTDSCTNRITPSRLLYLDANLSMHQTLLREQVSPAIIAEYEQIRWLNYIGVLYQYQTFRKFFTPEERKKAESKFHLIYQTFSSRPYRIKFGYTWFCSYTLFLAQERLYFLLRRIF